MPHFEFSRSCLLTVSLMFLASLAAGQDDFQPRRLEHSDYDLWNSLGQSAISRDGKWVLYSTRPGKGNPELTIRELASQKQFRIDKASNGSFTYDSQYVISIVQPDEEQLKKLRRAKAKPEEMPKPALVILDLRSGRQESVENVGSFSLAEESGTWMSYAPIEKKEPSRVTEEESSLRQSWQVTPEGLVEVAGESTAKNQGTNQSGGQGNGEKDADEEKKKEPGKWLVLRNLQTGVERRFPNVTSHVFSKGGRWLAYASSSEEPDEDGVFVVSLDDGQRRQVASGRGKYFGLAFDEQEKSLAF